MAKPADDTALELVAELRSAFTAIKRRIRQVGDSEDLTPAQKSAVLLLERDGKATVAMLAKAEGVRHQSMRITIASLEKLGAVKSEPDAEDARQKYFQLTAPFLKTLKSGRAAREDWLFRAVQTLLTRQEQQQLSAAAKLLNKLTTFEADHA